MHAYSTAEWQGLFIAEAGASAALASLLFVAISINLARILQGVGLSGRAGRIVLAQTAVLPLPVAGVSLLLGAGGGLYWLVPGVVFCLVVAVLNAWVLLIEILR